MPDAPHTSGVADFKCLGYGYSSITKQCVEAYEGAEFKPNEWSLYLKPAPKHDSAQMLYLAKKKIPELKNKAYEQHKTRHGEEYLERDAKEHTEKLRIQAEKEEKAFAERADKENAQKKAEAEAAVKKEEEGTQKTLETAEKKKDFDAVKCAEALKTEREADEVAHTCKVAQDDAEAAAQTAKTAMDHAQEDRAAASGHEASAKSQAAAGENEEQLATTAENVKAAEDKVVATEKDFDEKTKGAQGAAEKCPPTEAELAVAKKAVEETGAVCKEAQENAEKQRTAERESKYEAKNLAKKEAEMDTKAARRKATATDAAEEKVVKGQEADAKLKAKMEREQKEQVTKAEETAEQKKKEEAKEMGQKRMENESSVEIKLTLSGDVAGFEANKDNFEADLAAQLEVNRKQLHFRSVVAGSVIVVYNVFVDGGKPGPDGKTLQEGPAIGEVIHPFVYPFVLACCGWLSVCMIQLIIIWPSDSEVDSRTRQEGNRRIHSRAGANIKAGAEGTARVDIQREQIKGRRELQ